MNQDLATRDLGALARPPAFDLINERQLSLLRNRAAKGCSDSEIAQFLELCVAYKLDPYAQEVWCAKGRGSDGGEGRLLIMVGRDGLRKIAKRQGFELDGDIVREKDRFHVTRTPERQRVIEHEYEGSAEQRGPIVGAWAEAYDQRGVQRGYFFAPLSEYRPKNERQLKYSPWGSQESVMILAAAERQAARQATPLGGLLVEGEDARINEAPADVPASLADRISEWAPDADTADGILKVIKRAGYLGHAGLADYPTIELTLKGRPLADIELWIVEAWAELARFEGELTVAEGVADGEVVQDAEVVNEAEPETDAERAKRLNDRSLALADEADALEESEPDKAGQLREEAGRLHDEARAIEGVGQGDFSL